MLNTVFRGRDTLKAFSGFFRRLFFTVTYSTLLVWNEDIKTNKLKVFYANQTALNGKSTVSHSLSLWEGKPRKGERKLIEAKAKISLVVSYNFKKNFKKSLGRTKTIYIIWNLKKLKKERPLQMSKKKRTRTKLTSNQSRK